MNLRSSGKFLIAALSLYSLSMTATAQGRSFPLDLDPESYRRDLIHLVDMYNGGLDGQSGSGAYRLDFSGHFHTELDRYWHATGGQITPSISQSRQLFSNSLAYHAASGSDKDRFFSTTDKAMIHLVKNYKDTARGGFFAAVDGLGQVTDSTKDDFGNCQVLLALSAAYGTTGNGWQLAEALWQFDLLRTQYRDPQHPPGFLPSFSADFSSYHGYRSIECITHAFEGMMALYDVVDQKNKNRVGEAVQELGDFIVHRVYQEQAGQSGSGYVSYYYDDSWQPTSIPFSPQSEWAGGAWASPGHGAEIAYLLSRGVERGFSDAGWLTTADHLMKFALTQGYGWGSGGLLYKLDYQGRPYANDPGATILEWWPQTELARALIHFAVVRGRSDYLPLFKQQMAFIKGHFIDDQAGSGWYREVHRDWSQGAWRYWTQTTERGTDWLDAYHPAMLYSEVLRLAEHY